MKGFPGGLQQFMKQANQLQSKMKKAQEELDQKTYEGTSGGGAVKITIQGTSQITSVLISAELMKSGDVEMLQDLIQTAANDALKTAKETSSQEMEKVTGGMNVPGLF
jgi:DNA-binding YbaB/EbfC family protein